MVHKAKDSVGQALIRQQHSHKAQNRGGGIENKPALESVIDVTDLDTVIEQAELAGRVFSTLNPLPEVLVSGETDALDMLSPKERKQQQEAEEALYQSRLKIPRRPKWHMGMTPEELDVKERQSFLIWRRDFARLEDNAKLVITPFEKNLDIWRQLWRVLERSDLVVTVVDGRNPLFYRCADLEAYVKEIDSNKRTMLLVNKADLLPNSARVKWSEYFRSQGISFLFWSAKSATAVLEGKAGEDEVVEEAVAAFSTSHCRESSSCSSCEDTKVLGREELLDRLQAEAEHISDLRTAAFRASMASHLEQSGTQDLTKEEDGKSLAGTSYQNGTLGGFSRHAVVGFVGYPNVGKSSTINALVGKKRTGVTSTPGKTKHFQTLIISEKLMLCDCPGLVFPSFSSSRSDMVASGVLPIDRITDHRGPIQVVADLVPRTTLEELYGISLPKPKPYEPQDRPPAAFELLKAFCQSRGYVAGAGLADETRAARQILKDYVSGKLVHYHLPPSDNAGLSDSDEVKDEVEVSFKGEEVMADLDSFETTAGVKAPSSASKKNNVMKEIPSTFKMHKKAPRRKDRSWRVGNDESDGMPLVKGVLKPVSYGAARLGQTPG